jgi:hypothetical protein
LFFCYRRWWSIFNGYVIFVCCVYLLYDKNNIMSME